MAANPGLDAIITGNVEKYLSDPSNLPAPFLDGINQWLTLNPVPSNERKIVFNAFDYGAKGGGVTDDTVALQSAINDWILASYDLFGSKPQTAAVLFIPAGRYKITSPLTATFAHNCVLSKIISGYGAIIEPSFSSGHALDISVTAGQVRNLTLQGLHIDGTGLTDTTSALLHLGGGTVGSLYRVVGRDLTLESFRGDGILLDGDTWENQFYSCRIDNTGNTVGSGYHITNTGGGAVSSIDIYGGTVRGGLHNLIADSPQGGVKIYGGSWLQASNEGIYLGNSTEGAIVGAHVENAWQGGTASPSWTTSQAGIFVSGRVTLCGVTGTQNNSKMRYVARISANPVACVIGGMPISGCDYYLRAEGSSGSSITVIGTDDGASGVVHNGMSAGAVLTQLGATTLAPSNISTLSSAGAVLSAGATNGLGYTTGAGAVVTQATSKTTAVTINNVTGKITMNGAALASGATAVFSVNNSTVTTTDVVYVVPASGFGTPNSYNVTCDLFSAGGGFRIAVKNVSAGSLSEALVLNFVVLKGASS